MTSTTEEVDLVRVLPVLLAATIALAPVALASGGFDDPRGDASPGPDIVGVTLSSTDETMAIAVELAAAPPLGYDEEAGYTDMLLVGIHTDDDVAQEDVEFWTGVHGVDLTEAMVVAAEPRGRVGTADVRVEGAEITLELERALLDDPAEVAVSVAVAREYVDAAEDGGGEPDFAPDEGAFAYALSGGDGPPWLWPLVGVVGGAAIFTAGAVALRRMIRRDRVGATA